MINLVSSKSGIIGNIKKFLGLAGYYRRLIKDFSARAKPSSNLLKKEALFKWGPEEEKSFKDLR